MLSREDNEFLTRVGKGTPMGNFLRQFWFPFLPISEIPGPDARPLRVKLFGERLLIFRNAHNQIGLLSEQCPHRRASLYYGRHEDGALRCVYHGWKFAVDGQCLEIPNEANGPSFKDKIKHVAYPCKEVNGVVWVYMGTRAEPPALPDFGLSTLPAENKQLHVSVRQCNWMQALEGDLDLSHGAYLHSTLSKQFVSQNHIDRFTGEKAHLEALDTPYGATYAVRRGYDAQSYHWGIGHYLFPFITTFPPIGDRTNFVMGHVWIPIDDHNTLVLFYAWNPTGKFNRSYSSEMYDYHWEDYRPATSEPMGRWYMKAGPDNDFGFDEEAQRNIRYSGLPTVDLQDQALQVGMGPIVDREEEHLLATDLPLIRVRRRIMGAAKKLLDEGALPECIDDPTAFRVRAASGILPRNRDWQEVAREWVDDENSTRPLNTRGHAPAENLSKLPVS